jgi:hypothetical protein
VARFDPPKVSPCAWASAQKVELAHVFVVVSDPEPVKYIPFSDRKRPVFPVDVGFLDLPH